MREIKEIKTLAARSKDEQRKSIVIFVFYVKQTFSPVQKVIIGLLISLCFCNCAKKKETINFITLKQTEFNATRLKIPGGMITDSLKQSHDSCMGFSFDANAVFLQTRDTFFVGSIVKKQSLKIVNTLNDLALTQTRISSSFNILATPCYEKRVLHLHIKSLLGESFMLQLPGANSSLNKEINDAISASDEAEMQTGSWLYLDMKDALKNIVDTTNSIAGQKYRKNMLDTSNMVLTTVEGITDVTFIINTVKDMSEPLQALLQKKPTVSPLNSQIFMRLYYIKKNKFEISINGFFPMVGEFVKAELK